MGSFEDILRHCVDERHSCLKELEDKRKELKTQLEDLNSREQVIHLRKRREVRPGKKLKNNVLLWLEQVTAIKGRIKDTEKEIDEWYSSSTPGEIIDEVLKDIEKLSKKGKFSGSASFESQKIVVQGIGGVGDTQINLNSSTLNVVYCGNSSHNHRDEATEQQRLQ